MTDETVSPELRFKKMRDRTDDELKITIGFALAECKKAELDFWRICAGVDAYFEQRRRKELVEKAKATDEYPDHGEQG